MDFCIDGRFLVQSITGVQRYAIGIVTAMDSLLGENDHVTILLPRQQIVTQLSLRRIKMKQIGRLRGHLWTQINEMSYVRQHHLPLVSFTGLPPVFRPGFMTVHDLNFINIPEAYSWKYRALYSFGYHIALKRANRIFTVSECSKQQISHCYHISPDKIAVAYDGANVTAKAEPGFDHAVLDKFALKSGSYFFTVGSRSRHKNQRFIEDLARLRPDLTFVITGDANGCFNSEKHSPSGGQSNVIFTGYVSEPELAALYRNTKGLIMPSLYEGFGLPPLEAISLGCRAVAVSDIPVFREIYRNVYFFDPVQPESFDFDRFEAISVPDADFEYYRKTYSFERSAALILDEIGRGCDLLLKAPV
jgi:glycosyltransferase involved in cell wall biosynthesis